MYECREYHKLTSEGYGTCRYKGKIWSVHRLVFFLVHGYLPPVVMHVCDNPACFAIWHLVPGNHQQNMADMVKKKRHAHRELHPQHILTEADVSDIRSYRRGIKGLVKRLAAKYGVSASTIYHVRSNRRWREG